VGALWSSGGRRWVQTALELTDAQTPLATLAALDLAEAGLAMMLVQHRAGLAAAERALARYHELGDPLRSANAQRLVGRALVFLRRSAEGEAGLTQALAEARRLGARRLTGRVLENLASARQRDNDLAGARQYFAEALAIFCSIGAERGAAVVAINLAEAEFRGGDASTALRLADEAQAVFPALNDTSRVATALANTAAYLVALERYDEARTSAREGLTAARDAQATVTVAFTLQHLAAIAALRTIRCSRRCAMR
jgi:tetratricopeptide (TPR) repeat protein